MAFGKRTTLTVRKRLNLRENVAEGGKATDEAV
jgi:hypothetical protein